MPDVFGNSYQIKNDNRVLSANNLLVDLDGTLNLVQSANVVYQQTVNPQYESGSTTTYLVVGNPNGQAQLTSLVGSGVGLLGNVTTKISDNCEFKTLSFVATGDCPTISTEKSVKLDGCTLQSVGLSYNVQSLVVTSSLNFFFLAMTAQ